MARIASDALIERLADWGVDTVFGLPGDGINGIMEALRRNQDKVRFVLVHHEEAAAFMATAHAKATGKIGVCLATSGRLRPPRRRAHHGAERHPGGGRGCRPVAARRPGRRAEDFGRVPVPARPSQRGEPALVTSVRVRAPGFLSPGPGPALGG